MPGLRALLVASLLWLAPVAPCCADEPPPATANGLQVLEQFQQAKQQAGQVSAATQHQRQVIMFSLGAVLLLLLIGTACVGAAVAIFGKPLFVLHMTLAGLTVTMAIVHVIVGVVWFFPF